MIRGSITLCSIQDMSSISLRNWISFLQPFWILHPEARSCLISMQISISAIVSGWEPHTGMQDHLALCCSYRWITSSRLHIPMILTLVILADTAMARMKLCWDMNSAIRSMSWIRWFFKLSKWFNVICWIYIFWRK